MKVCRKIPRRANRGSVIVLVVAVLALLAVIGTVYIVSARTERTSADAGNAEIGLEQAQKTVNTMVADTIGASMYDSNGTLGGYDAQANGAFGTHAARRFDIPELNLTEATNGKAVISNIGTAFYTNAARAYNVGLRDEAWLVSDLYVPQEGIINFTPSPAGLPQWKFIPIKGETPDMRYNEMSLLTPYGFNPATGTYDPNMAFMKPTYPGNQQATPASVPDSVPNGATLNGNLFDVVAPDLATSQNYSSVPVPINTSAHAWHDAFIQLLPYADPNGVRYRFGIRILDTSRMANLNVGADTNESTVGSLTAMQNEQLFGGTYYNSYMLGTFGLNGSPVPPGVFNSNDPLGALDANASYGRMAGWNAAGSASPMTKINLWLGAALRLDAPTSLGSYSASNFVSAAAVHPFDLADELELRAYGVNAYSFNIPAGQASSAWLLTLEPTFPQSPSPPFRRADLTAYSYTRTLRPTVMIGAKENREPLSFFTTPSTSLTAGLVPTSIPAGQVPPPIWPRFPSPVNVNPDVSTLTNFQQAADTLVIAACNTATAMSYCGFSQLDSQAFALNYLQYRWNGWQVTSGTYSLPAGPAVMDGSGFYLRVQDKTGKALSFTYTSANLASDDPNTLYIAYAAQPFINEVATNLEAPPPTSPPNTNATVTDWAIELYNPYAVALSMDDYQILARVKGGPPIAMSFAAGTVIPANGYLVIHAAGGGAGLKVIGTSTPPPATFSLQNADDIFLARKITLPKGGAAYAAIDHYNVQAIADVTTMAPGDSPRSNQDLSRDNAAATTSIWAAAVETDISEQLNGSTAVTLGVANAHTGARPATDMAPALFDRVIDKVPLDSNAQQDYQRALLINIADFNRIGRRVNIVDLSTTINANGTNFYIPGTNPSTNASIGVIPTQLAGFATGSKVSDAQDYSNSLKSSFQLDTCVHFDFLTIPAIYSVPGEPAVSSVLANQPLGDQRAVKLLNCITLVDRVSDRSIDAGDNNDPNVTVNGNFKIGGTPGLSKLRIPGQINVNTASIQVLATIPYLYQHPQYIAAILAYRWRTVCGDTSAKSDGRFPPWFPPALPAKTFYDFSTSAVYPGYGIRSMAELETALIPLGQTFKSLDDRDQVWANLFNYLTVRSDTFVMYGYLEAVRPNPRYNGQMGFDNSSVWYGSVKGGTDSNNVHPVTITDDPNDPTMPLLRVGRKRWVAIVDRSMCNYSRSAVTLSPPAPQVVLDPRWALPRIVASKDLPE